MHTKSFSLPPSLPLPSFLRFIELYSLFFNDNLTYFKYGHLWNVNSVAVGTFTINRRNFQVRTPSIIVIFALQFRRQVKDCRIVFWIPHLSQRKNFQEIIRITLKFIFHSKYYVSFQNVDSNENVRKKNTILFRKNLSSRFMLSTPKCLGKGRGSLEASR